MKLTRQNIFRWLGLSTCCWLAATSQVHGAESGDQVIVIYNTRVPESKEVAKHYAALRHVPESQIHGVSLSTGESMTREEFRDQLQKPLFRWLEDKSLFRLKFEAPPEEKGAKTPAHWRVTESKIRYAVLCYGIPIRILKDASLVEEGTEKLTPELRRNEAAVDTELCLLPASELKLPLFGPLQNPVYGVTNGAMINPVGNILMVARLDGPTPAIAKGLVDKAIQAETNGLWGRGYFDARGLKEGPYKLGDDWIRNAATAVRKAGFETVLDEQEPTFSKAFPLSQVAFYAGWYNGTVSGPFTRPSVEFMPGAVAYHLHSFSAQTLRSDSQNWVGPLLAQGATASLGCIEEPYLSFTPDVGMLFHRLTEGFSFGEAAYAAQGTISWQTTVVGDPLYRPFAVGPQFLHQELEKRQSKLVEWSHLRVADLLLAKGYPTDDAIKYLQQIKPITDQSAVLLEKLADLFATVGKKESAILTYQKALKQAPSPQQSVRLQLVLGAKLEEAGKAEEAFLQYQHFLKNTPDYPDPAAVLQRLIPLATRLEKKTEAEQLQRELDKLAAASAKH